MRHVSSPRIALLASVAVLAAFAASAGASPHVAVGAGNPISSDWSAKAEKGGLPGFDPGLPDLDNRGADVAPSALALAGVRALGRGIDVAWTSFGTPRTLVPTGAGWLGTGLRGSAVTVARTWLSNHAAIFGLTPTDVAGLELVNDAPLGTEGHAVLFRQHYGSYLAAQDGLVAVGVRGDKVAGVSGSIVPATALLNATEPVLNPQQAFLSAAHEIGRKALNLSDISLSAANTADFVSMKVRGFAQPGLTRLRALGTPSRGIRLVYETDLVDSHDGSALAYVSFVDALNGQVLLRHSAVDQLAANDAGPKAAALAGLQNGVGSTVSGASAVAALPTGLLGSPSGGTIQGSYSAAKCGAMVPISIPAGAQQLVTQINEINPLNDVKINIYRGTAIIGSDDTLVAEEVTPVSIAPPAVASDKFAVQFCPVPNSTVPQQNVGPYTVVGVYITLDQALTAGAGNLPYPAKWRYFESNPNLPGARNVNTDARVTACWGGQANNASVSKPVNDCKREISNLYSRLAWDIDPQTGLPTFNTIGNNADTAQAWISPLTPAEPYHYASPTRDYTPTWTNQWLTEKCNPSVFASPQRADVDASIVNLFAGHNRIHDFSYRLGYTERNYNMQLFNFGETAPRYQNDPEVGNVQAGALTGAPAATGLGRDNANQITLQDGTPGITNQYLFQPVVGFWAPCTDGDMDGLIFTHEYTHAISNRMIAGPDTGLSGTQGGAMGESWSDLDAVEYLNATGVAGSTGADPYSAGAYATNNKIRAIRDYNLLHNPLMYGDVGFDSTGPEVHADGEIWNGVQMHVRQELINKYQARYPADDKLLQLSCAFGTDYKKKGSPASGFDNCPGNRRWIQYIYDAWLLEANGSPTYVDMKNMMLVATKVRTGGTDFPVMATAFAQRGLGLHASSKNSEDSNEIPDFTSPVVGVNSQVTVRLQDAATGKLVGGQVFVGRYEARCTPYVLVSAGRAATATFAGGRYEFVVRAPGYGISRATGTFVAGQPDELTIKLDRNYAAQVAGASITGDGIRLAQMIDEEEGTNGGYNGLTTAASKTGPAAGTSIAGKQVTIALAGGAHSIRRFNVSTLHHPANTAESTDFQGRLLGLRAFDVYVSSDGGRSYHKVYASAANAFPAGYPRPVAPDLIIRSFVLPKAVVADHVRLVIRSNQCTGTPEYRGDSDNDPTNNPDCLLTDNAFKVTISEIQVFGGLTSTATPGPVFA